MKDDFKKFHVGMESPCEGAEAITAHDTDQLDFATRAIYVGGAGNIRVDMVSDDTVTFNGVVAGTILPIRVRKVYSTGTTATNLIGLR